MNVKYSRRATVIFAGIACTLICTLHVIATVVMAQEDAPKVSAKLVR